MRLYEAMFLMEPTLASDWPAAEAEINRLMERAEAKLMGITSWGERKLAYPIGHRRRGLYALSFFEAAPESIVGLERDVQLSDKTFRVLVVRREKMTPEAVEQALAAEPPAKTPARGEELGGRYHRDRDRDRDRDRHRPSEVRGEKAAPDKVAAESATAKNDAPAEAKDVPSNDTPAKPMPEADVAGTGPDKAGTADAEPAPGRDAPEDASPASGPDKVEN